MTIREFHVVPSIPQNLQALKGLAYNLLWTWDPYAMDIFRRLDMELWEGVGHNPVLLFGKIRQERLQEVAQDASFLAHLRRTVERQHDYMESPSWFARQFADLGSLKVAYFSAEFGVAECLPIYSGGLGVLAGDHLKASSDLGLPLVGVGLLYQKGYFRQYLNQDGWQQESTPVNDFFNMPMRLVRHPNGSPVLVDVEYPGRLVRAQLWRVDVGRVPLYLLDSNVPENRPDDREITDQLYGGDADKRIRQEILLGIGGLRALEAIGIHPQVCHMNEGHSAFLALERIRRMMEVHHMDFPTAREAVAVGNLFTTHTPVPAGFDLFPPDLMEHYFAKYRETIRLGREEFLALGRENPSDPGAFFNMAILAIRLSATTNAVSQLHARVSRHILGGVWRGVPEKDVPITHVTNGVHFQSWVSRDMRELLQRYLGDQWLEDFTAAEDWHRIATIPDEELWRTHERRRERLIATVRRRLERHLRNRGASRVELETAREVLHPGALTIGFARRFATYKRGTLLLHDADRLRRILTNKERPVQVIYAGKAHPRDHQGKELIRNIVHFARDAEIRRRLVFVDDYDMDLARYLVQGVDVWLNTPQRLMEASGTSGMKSAMNGGLNLSILDGWWYEAYRPEIGWAIGGEEQYDDPAFQDAIESRALYDLLEKEVIPLFYERGSDGLPRRWIGQMKRSMQALGPSFNGRRMVREYSDKFYVPGARRWAILRANECARARALAEWKQKVNTGWKDVRLESLDTDDISQLSVGSTFEVRALVSLGHLRPEDVLVEVYHGVLNEMAAIVDAEPAPMAAAQERGGGSFLFTGKVSCRTSGRCGFALRVLPRHPDLASPYELGLVSWF